MESIKLYKSGTIYKLYGFDSNNNELIYIGSTVNPLCNRKALHKYHAKKHKAGEFKGNCSSFRLYDECEGVMIEALEVLKICTLKELRAREDEYISKLDCVNKNNAKMNIEKRQETLRRCAKNYYYKNIEQEKAKKREYYKNNKEACLVKVKEYHKTNYEKMLEYQRNYARKYYKRPEVKEKMKQYREANREKTRAYAKERYYRLKKNNISNINNE